MRTMDYIICDDDKFFLDKMKKIVDDYNFKHNINAYVHTFTNYGKEFMEIMHKKTMNKVYILDIETPNRSGKDIAREIRSFDYNSIIIFVSNHSDMAGNVSMDLLDILTFIPKFDDCDNRLKMAISRVHEMIGSRTKFCFKSKDTTFYLHYEDIIYITYNSKTRKSTVVTDEKNYETSLSLKECFQKLTGEFRYSHRSCIVNENRIKQCTKEEIIFDNDKKINLISSMFFDNK